MAAYFETGLVSHLLAQAPVTAIVGQRIYPVMGEDGGVTPYLTFQVTGAPLTERTFSGRSTHRTVRLDISCWSDEYQDLSAYEDVIAASHAVFNALHGGSGTFGGDVVEDILFLDWRDLPEWREGAPPLWRRQSDYEVRIRRND